MNPGDPGYDEEVRAKAMDLINKDREERADRMNQAPPEKPGVIMGAQASTGIISAVDQ